MALPRISSGLIDQPAGGSGGGDAPRGRLIMIAGPAGRGPTRPQLITDAQQAYNLYGDSGPLADDVALALRGAELGSASEDQNQVGQVLALRTPTGSPASLTVTANTNGSGPDVFTLETATGGEDANGWTFTPNENSVKIYDPESEQTAEFNYDPSGGANDITTPTELAEAIMDATNNRLLVEVQRSSAHFELSVQSSSMGGSGVDFSTSDADTTLDFTETSVSEMETLALGGNTAIGDDTDAFDTSSSNDPVHNYILPENQDEARFYAITAGEATAIPEDFDEGRLTNLADKKRVDVGTGSILNLHTGKDETATLAEAGKRDTTTKSEAYDRVRNKYAGRIDLTATTPTITAEAPNGIADNDGSGNAGPLAVSYAQDFTGDGTLTASDSLTKDLSVNRLTPEEYEKFEDGRAEPVEILIAPVTDPDDVEDVTDALTSKSWSSDEATLELDPASIAAEYDEAIVYVSFDSCIYDLNEVSSTDDLSAADDFTIDGQTLVFGEPRQHETIIRPLRVTQYQRGHDLEVRRTTGGGNEFVFKGTDNQPGAAGEQVTDLETIIGFDYDYEPDFPAAENTIPLSGATSGVSAGPQARAQALETALRQHGKVDHDMLVASGLHVDEMQSGTDPVTGATTDEPVGVLSIIERHQQRQRETGASPIAFTAVKPMEPSTPDGRFTDAQKLSRVAELTQTPDAGDTNAASIIQDASRPEVFIFDAPLNISIGGSPISRQVPALWAGIRSTLTNTTTLHRVDISAIGETLYKYDVAGADLPGRLDAGRINTWDPRRDATRLAGERTAAGFLLNQETGQLEPSGWQSGIALLAAKTFQQDAEDQLRVLTGQAMPSGGAEVLRGSIETMIQGIVERTSGVRRILMEPQQDIQIRAEENNSLGIYITAELVVNGEISRIDLQVGAVTEPQLNNSQDGNQIPTAQ